MQVIGRHQARGDDDDDARYSSGTPAAANRQDMAWRNGMLTAGEDASSAGQPSPTRLGAQLNHANGASNEHYLQLETVGGEGGDVLGALNAEPPWADGEVPAPVQQQRSDSGQEQRHRSKSEHERRRRKARSNSGVPPVDDSVP